MGKLIDLTGKVFGKLKVIGRYGTKTCGNARFPTWLCQCDCGNKTVVMGHNLRQGYTKSCGQGCSKDFIDHGDFTGIINSDKVSDIPIID